MSTLYCTIPHFPVALVRRDRSALGERPLVLLDPNERVFDASPEVAACGIVPGLTARMAQIRCPEAHLLEADVAYCRQELERLYRVLERTGTRVEPHGWGAAYVSLGDLVRGHAEAIKFCGETGRALRRALGDVLQPALGWDSTKFTAQAAARRTRPGRLLAVAASRERAFLDPLPVTLLPLARDALRRLSFLGLRTLGQYAALPSAAVWQQFGRAGRLAHRCARGQDDRPIISRQQEPSLVAGHEFETPLYVQEQLRAVLGRVVTALLRDLQEDLRACGQLRLTLEYENGEREERVRAFLYPTAQEAAILGALEQLVDKVSWPAPVTALSVTLEQIQDAVMEQLALFPTADERDRKLREVQRYLTARFGANCLRRAALVQPAAPMPEWRVGWIEDAERTGYDERHS